MLTLQLNPANMPLVLMCGIPCCGKSTRAEQLKNFLVEKYKITVDIVSESGQDIHKNDVYGDSKKEKDRRGFLKSEVQRKISKNEVTILDSLNYIKGYRYELYCLSKSAQTPQCVIHCDINPAQASDWNQQREPTEQYSQEILDALVMRLEPPESRNRWDAPLFLVQPDDELPCQQIYDALFLKKAPPPNKSTLSQPLSSTNFLHELDRVTQSTVQAILELQKTSVPGDTLSVPLTSEKIELNRPVTLPELQRHRRLFISMTKTRPVEDNNKLATMFVQYLNNSL